MHMRMKQLFYTFFKQQKCYRISIFTNNSYLFVFFLTISLKFSIFLAEPGSLPISGILNFMLQTYTYFENLTQTIRDPIITIL